MEGLVVCRWKLILTSLLILGIVPNCVVGVFAQELSSTVIVPVEEFQKVLREVADLSVSQPVLLEGSEGHVRYKRLIDELLEKVQGDKVTLLRQWIYCYHTYVRQQEGARRSNMAISMQGIMAGFEPTAPELANAFYPLLDSLDPELCELAKEFIGWSDNPSTEVGVDFGVFETVLRKKVENREEIPVGLIAYMYRRAPGDALIAMMSLDAKVFADIKSSLGISDQKSERPLSSSHRLKLNAEHSRDVIRGELEKISLRPEWWIQLFVAEFTAQAPDVDSEAIRMNLSKSDNLLVTQVLANPDKYRMKRKRSATSK